MVHKLAVSQPYSMIVSADIRNTIILWDLNRLKCIREVSPFVIGGDKDIVDIVINNITGDFTVATTRSLYIFSINGDLLGSVDCMTSLEHRSSMDMISSVAVSEGPDYFGQSLIFTGHHSGAFGIWRLGHTRTPAGTIYVIEYAP